MIEISALAFVQWLYSQWDVLTKTTEDSESIISRWDAIQIKAISEFARLIWDENQVVKDKKWKLIPFFICTANGKREFIFKEIFKEFEIGFDGIIQLGVKKYLELQNIDNVTFKSLSEGQTDALIKSVTVLKKEKWRLLDFNADELWKLSLENKLWLETVKDDSITLSSSKPVDVERIANVRSVISGNPALLQMA